MGPKLSPSLLRTVDRRDAVKHHHESARRIGWGLSAVTWILDENETVWKHCDNQEALPDNIAGDLCSAAVALTDALNLHLEEMARIIEEPDG